MNRPDIQGYLRCDLSLRLVRPIIRSFSSGSETYQERSWSWSWSFGFSFWNKSLFVPMHHGWAEWSVACESCHRIGGLRFAFLGGDGIMVMPQWREWGCILVGRHQGFNRHVGIAMQRCKLRFRFTVTVTITQVCRCGEIMVRIIRVSINTEKRKAVQCLCGSRLNIA